MAGRIVVNKPKNQGTAWESAIVAAAQAFGIPAERIAEGGVNDLGDVRILTDDGTVWIVEAKHRNALNIHDTLNKAIAKSGTRNTAVIWKRSVRKKGNKRRTQVGVPVVAMEVETFLRLLGGRPE